MKRSTERILTTHTGSLPRPDDLVAMLQARDLGQPYNRAVFDARVKSAVAEVVKKQVSTGLDVVNDGEMSKISYSAYVKERLTGFEGESTRVAPPDLAEFPGLARKIGAIGEVSNMKLPACNGPVALKDKEAVATDIANFKAALKEVEAVDAFMTAASPGVVSHFLQNSYYPTHEAYVYAIAEAMKPEYKAICDAGFVLQLDCPDLAMARHSRFAGRPLGEFRDQATINIEALNYALEGLPPELLRLHLCWGNYAGPHHRDVPLRDIVDVVFKTRATAISLEGANPRHAHEWQVFKDVKLPDGKILIPGVIDSTTNFVEHPELVAERICRYANVIGRENLIAGVDCGMSTFAGHSPVDPRIAYLKLRSLVEGAELASRQLW